MENFNFTPKEGARQARPSAARIVAAWKKAGRPTTFSVTYGETYAEFNLHASGMWYDSGNGCRGVDRSAVVEALNLAPAEKSKSDFVVATDGPGPHTIYLLVPMNSRAESWVRDHLDGAHRLGVSVAVEHRYIEDIVNGIKNDGLTVR